MAFVADFLLGAGALGVAAYCLVLSRRLRRFSALEGGMGGAIAVLSAQVDDLTRLLQETRKAAAASADALDAQTKRANREARRLEMLMAALHDLPEPAERPMRDTPPGQGSGSAKTRSRSPFGGWWETAGSEATDAAPDAVAGQSAKSAAPVRRNGVRVIRRSRIREAAG